jgi:hypothetical protein
MVRFRTFHGLPLLVAIVLMMPALVGADPVSDPGQTSLERDCLPHPPIVITEDEGPEGFVLYQDPMSGLAIYRPGSGVVAGGGTPEDPYLIHGWCIDRGDWPEELPAEGISIKETRAHVVVRNVLVSSFAAGTGIRIHDAANVVVENSVIRDNEVGITVIGDMTEPHGPVTLQANKIFENTRYGVYVAASRVSIQGNEFAQNIGGVFFDSDSAETHLQGNRVEDNRFVGNTFGFGDYARHKTPILHNAFINNRIALAIHGEADVRHNVLEGNEDGAALLGGGAFQQNNLDDGQRVRVFLDGVALQENWWGHPSGPGGGLPDACTGTTADGEGAQIARWSLEPICFDPWSAAPHTDAGPRP